MDGIQEREEEEAEAQGYVAGEENTQRWIEEEDKDEEDDLEEGERGT